jgi:hypothetical protein
MTMRRVMVSLGLMVAVAQPGTAADRSGARDPGGPVPGTLEIQGEEVKAGILRLQITLEPLSGGPYALGALKVFAEPSHTLLFAAADPARLGPGAMAILVAERPAARVEGRLDAGISPVVTFRWATTSDTRVRIEYVLLGPNTTRVSHTVRDVTLGSLSRFAFKTGPRLGVAGDSTFVGVCSNPAGQAQADCPGERVTACCLDSPCWVGCGDVRCPKEETKIR